MEETKFVGISRQLPAMQIVVDLKRPDSVEIFISTIWVAFKQMTQNVRVKLYPRF